ncbi:MAG: hypothetical protein PHY85_07170 [Bacteroidales bacterium]|nr:hypothetical protein [Bacteroidales bacterium]
MKHLTILICATLLSVGLFAQEVDMLSKRGEMILPQQGEMALGIDAMPVFGYFGDLFNGTVGNNTNFGFVNGLYNANTIYVKYYLEDQVAIRGAVRIGYENWIDKEFVTMDQQIPDPLVQVTDKYTFNSTNIGVGADYLMYRGKGRVQGYYGGGAFINYNSWRDSYTYGNPITTQFSSPNWFDFEINPLTGDPFGEVSGGERILEQYSNNDFGITLRGVIGVEYFFAPKISVGGEMGLGINFNQDGGFQTVERWTGTEVEVETTELPHDNFKGVDNFTSASCFIMFHF